MHIKLTNRTRFSALKLSRLATCFILFFLLCTYGAAWSQHNICQGSIKRYAVDTTENAGLGTTGSIYNWSISGTGFIGSMTPTVVGATNAITIDWRQTPPGTYSVKVQETTISGCTNLKVLQVIINLLPIVYINDLVACTDPISGVWLNTETLQTSLSSSMYSFVWQFDNGTGNVTLPNTTSSIPVTAVGLYTVTAINLVTGCQTSDTATVTESSAPQATVLVENPFESIQTIIVTITSGVGSYEYSIDGSNFQDSPIFNVTEPGNYTVIVRDKFYCGETKIKVNVIGYPTFFTPNGDGYNDTWNIIGLPNASKAKLYVFDRYGKLIKQILPSSSGWDGTFNGMPIISTDYWFTLEYYDSANQPQIFKSHFSLKR
jgi:gliding motility-associated-like protein